MLGSLAGDIDCCVSFGLVPGMLQALKIYVTQDQASLLGVVKFGSEPWFKPELTEPNL